jgi:hypothetical protein
VLLDAAAEPAASLSFRRYAMEHTEASGA